MTGLILSQVLVGGCLSVRQQHMTKIFTVISDLPPEQRAIRDKCFHATGKFIEFKKEEIEQSIPDRFEQQVAKYPDRLAVKTKSDTFTYDQLNKAANRVAHAILAQGRGGEEPIVLLLEHGAAMIAGILGVLKAGKIYVPLDASCPLSRLRHILGDSQAGLVVTDNQSISLTKELGSSLQVLNVGEFHATVAHENPGLSIPPERLTYIIYTSGSTGQPKGVVQNHLNVLHLIMRYTNRAHIIASDRIGLVKSFSVNGGTLHTLGALLNGAAILPFDLKQEGIGKLAKWLSQEEITVCSLSPTTFRQLVASLSEDTSIYKLRTIHFSGEPLRKRDVDLCREYFSPASIVNSLGST